MGSPSEARTILVIVICLIFVICYLEFLVTLALKYSKTARNLYWQSYATLTPEDLGLSQRMRFPGLSGTGPVLAM